MDGRPMALSATNIAQIVETGPECNQLPTQDGKARNSGVHGSRRCHSNSGPFSQGISILQCASFNSSQLPKLKITPYCEGRSPVSASSAAHDGFQPLRLPALLSARARSKGAVALPDSECRSPITSAPHVDSEPVPAPLTPPCHADAGSGAFGAINCAAQPSLLRTRSQPPMALLAAAAEAADANRATGAASGLVNEATIGHRTVVAVQAPMTPNKLAARAAGSAPLLSEALEAERLASVSLGPIPSFGEPRRAVTAGSAKMGAGVGATVMAAPVPGAAKAVACESSSPAVASIEADPTARPILLATSPATPPEMQRTLWRMDDYSFLRREYKGSISVVYKARCQCSGMTVALKIYALDVVPANTLHMLAREIKIHSTLAHPHIAALYGAFQDGKYLVMVQEWAARGDLHSVHRTRGRPLSEEQLARVVLGPFLSALAFLHARGICHRDVKPENILFTAEWQLKLADFGVSIDLAKERAVTRTGTLDYMAPEVGRCPIKCRASENKERRDIAYTYAADVWSTGILAYELLLGFPPFADGIAAAAAAAAAGVATGAAPPHGSEGVEAAGVDGAAAGATKQSLQQLLPPPLPRSLTAGARDFIRSALAADPAERPSALQLLRHPWLVGLAAARGSSAAACTPQA